MGRYFERLQVVVGVLIGILLACVVDPHGRCIRGENDFAAFYAGARLAGTQDLYSPSAAHAIHREVLGKEMESVTFIRPPFYAWLLKPLAGLPYQRAYWLFQVVNLSSFVLAVWFLAGSYRELRCLALIFPPLIVGFVNGQDTLLLLGLSAGTLWLTQKRQDFAAGLVLSLCAIKPHLYVFVPLALVIQRRFRILSGAVVGTVVLALISLAGVGPAAFSDWIQALARDAVHPNLAFMANLRGLVTVLNGRLGLEIGLIAATSAMTLWMAWRSDAFDAAFAWCLLGGLLVSPHTYLQDCVLVLLIAPFTVLRSPSSLVKGLGVLAISPPVFLIALVGSPWTVLPPAMLLGGLMLAWWSTVSSGNQGVRIPRPVDSLAYSSPLEPGESVHRSGRPAHDNPAHTAIEVRHEPG